MNRRGANQSLGRAEEARGERDVGPVCRESQCSRTATVQLIIPNALFQENDVSKYEPRKPEQQHNVECGAKRCRSDTEE